MGMGNIFCPYMLGWTDLQTVWALTVNKPEAYMGVAELFLLLSPSQPHTYTCITHKPEILTVFTTLLKVWEVVGFNLCYICYMAQIKV